MSAFQLTLLIIKTFGKSKMANKLRSSIIEKLKSKFRINRNLIWDVRCALKHRYFNKYHIMQTGLNPWRFHEVETRMLFGNFTALVDFVEIEQAWMMIAFGQTENIKKFGYKWYETNRWINWFLTDRRYPEAGLEHLDWASSLTYDDAWYGNHAEKIEEAKASVEYGKPTPQALAAIEIRELYNWWKNIRPNRPDPHDASGYSDYFKKLEAVFGNDFFASITHQSSELSKEGKDCMISFREIEMAYDTEDEQMLIRLVKIRQSLWT